MRQIFLLFFITISAAIAANSFNPSIKSIRTTTYQAVQKESSWVTGAVIARVNSVIFLPDGREISEKILNADGSIYRKKVSIYNDEKQLTAVNTYDESAKLIQFDTLMYNAKGKLFYRASYDRFKIKQSDLNYDYDNQNRLISESFSNLYGQSRRTNFKYDAENQLYETYYIDNSGRLRRAEVHTYDDSGKLVKTERYDNKNEQGRTKVCEYIYDDHNQWVTKIEFTNDIPEYIIKRDIVYDSEQDAWMGMNLNDKVKSMKQTSYLAIQKGSDIERGQPHGEFADYFFDSQGKITSQFSYDDKGRLLRKIAMEYDKDGLLVKKNERTDAGELTGYSIYTYNEYKQLKKQAIHDKRDSILNTVVYIYDPEGNLKEELWFNADSSPLCKYTYTVDAYGRMVEKNTPFYSNKESLYCSEKYEYNFQNKIKEKKQYLPSSIDKKIYKYNYGKSGRVISGEEILPGNVKNVYNYKFYNDGHGNWKKRIKFVGDKAVLYEERVYTYYE